MRIRHISIVDSQCRPQNLEGLINFVSLLRECPSISIIGVTTVLIFFRGMGLQELSTHAVYMRLKRLCEMKVGGLQVDEATHKEWMEGNRDTLALALTTALRKFGFQNNKKTRDAVRVGR